MVEWIQVGLLSAILLVQLLRWLLDAGLWAEWKQRLQLWRKRKANR